MMRIAVPARRATSGKAHKIPIYIYRCVLDHTEYEHITILLLLLYYYDQRAPCRLHHLGKGAHTLGVCDREGVG